MSFHGWLYSEITPVLAHHRPNRPGPRPASRALGGSRLAGCPPPSAQSSLSADFKTGVSCPACRSLGVMFGDTQAGCQRIADAYNGLRARCIKPDRISEWFYGEDGELKGLVDKCRLTGVCDPELLFHVRGYRSATLDGGRSEGVHAGVSKLFKSATSGLLSWVTASRRMDSNVEIYRKAVRRQCKGRFLKGFQAWKTILDKPTLHGYCRGSAKLKRHEAIAKIYRFGPRCVDDWGNLQQIADQLRKDARLEPLEVSGMDKSMVEYLRATLGKGDMLSFPVNDVSPLADAVPPVASLEDGTVAVARAPNTFAVVRILDFDPLRSKLVQPPALRRTGFTHTAAVQRYLRANSWGGRG